MNAVAAAAYDAIRAPVAAWEVGCASWAPAAALATLQGARRRALLDDALERSAWVRALYGGIDPHRCPPGQWPVMRKAAGMRRFDDWVADPRLRLAELRRFTADPARVGEAFADGVMAWESSGSSGEPALFVHDAAAMAVYDALEALRRPVLRPWRRWFDPAGLAERTAFVGATGGHFATTVSVERLRRLNPALGHALRSFSFLLPADELVAQLNRYRPTVLTTYPTAALLLAEQAAAGRLAIEPGEIWTGGETLSAATRRFVEQVFGCPVVQSYGASEFLPLAGECLHRSLHLNADWALLEPVDRSGRPVAEGRTPHTTLLTNLANRLQPLIRYDLGDRVRFVPGRCACGSALPVIEVQGRSDDALVLDDARGRPVRLLPLALTTVIEEEAAVFAFQIEQNGPATLKLRVAQGGPAGEAAMRRACSALAGFLRLHGLPKVCVEACCGEPCVRGRSGKVVRVRALRRTEAGAPTPTG